ncbi:carboxypeptidase regulatory-like domain-containing protein [Acidobacteria bacterium AH-259-D05]|nr:carboxypeptidase regulatory-like domain-containing protein [Acidobacteria bacterium AH-259-D05]
MFRLFPILLVLTFHFSLAWAQVTTATILGTVTDATGGVLPGVSVTVTHLETNTERNVITDDLGRYRVPQLTLGEYEVTAELVGFQAALRRGLQLTLGQEAVVNITLSVGEITEQVIVTGAAPLVETTNSEVSGLIDDKQIRDLPLNGRSFTELAVLQPGVVTARAAGRSLIVGLGQKISVNGSRTNASSFILDGTDINDSMGQAPGSVNGFVLGVETVREFKTLTSNFSSEYGRAAGGVITAVTKSGTNELHGSLFEFHRNSAVDARNFFDAEVPHFVRNQFGAVVGGPIVKDQTFFLGSFELLRNREGLTTGLVDVPNAAARQGLLPLGEVDNCQDVRGSECFVGVVPDVQPYLDLYPLPTGKDNRDGTGEWSQVFTREENEEYFLGKIDHNFSESDSFFVRYTYQDADGIGPSSQTNVVDFTDRTRNQYVTIEERHIFSPTLLNVARFGFNRSLLNSTDGINNPAVDDPALAFIRTGDFEHMGRLDITGLSSIGRSFNRPRFRVLNLFEYSDTVTYTSGPHSLKFGVNYKRYHQNHNQSNREFGVFVFRGLEDFLTNDPFSFGGARPCCRDYRRGDRQHIPSLFIQDDFQVRPNLIVNLGLRWEAATANKEVNGKTSQIDIFNDSNSHAESPNYEIPLNNLAPRLGFAWDPGGSGRTAIRGAFGMFHHMILADFYFGARQQAPFVDQLGVRRSSSVRGFFPDPFGAPASGRATRIETVDRDVVTPYYMQWNLNIQRELLGEWSLMVGYVGSRGVNLTRYVNPNSAIPDILPDGRFFWPDKRDQNGVACTEGPTCKKTKRRNPAFTRVRHRVNGGDSYYHALQTTMNKRFADNYQVRINYTWGKSIDTSSQQASSDFNNTNTMGVDYYNVLAHMRSVSTFHLSHAFTTTFTWEMPFLQGAGGAAEAILGGWSLSGIASVTSGTPVTLEMSDRIDRERDRTDGSASRPNLIPGGDNNPVSGEPSAWFGDPSAPNFPFAGPEPGFHGNLGRLTGRGDDFANFDFSLKKDTRLAEDVSLQFRAEFFNIFNHPNFSTPTRSNRQPFNRSVSKPNRRFGKLTRTDNSSRQVQFALKLLF